MAADEEGMEVPVWLAIAIVIYAVGATVAVAYLSCSALPCACWRGGVCFVLGVCTRICSGLKTLGGGVREHLLPRE